MKRHGEFSKCYFNVYASFRNAINLSFFPTGSEIWSVSSYCHHLSVFVVVREPPSPPENFTTKQVPYGITLQWQRPMNPEVPVNGYIVGYGRFIPEVYREILGDNKLQYTIHKLSKVLKLCLSSFFSTFSYWLVLLFHQFSNTCA